MLGRMICLAVLFGRVELESDAEDDSGVAVESELAIKVTQVCWNTHQCCVFSALTEFVSSALTTQARGEGTRGVTFGILLAKGRFGIRGIRTKFAKFLIVRLETSFGTRGLKILS